MMCARVETFNDIMRRHWAEIDACETYSELVAKVCEIAKKEGLNLKKVVL